MMVIKLTNQNTGKILTMYKDNVLDALNALRRYLNQDKYDVDSVIIHTANGYQLKHNGHIWNVSCKSISR